MADKRKLITVAIHTYEQALILKSLLESEGVPVVIHNVNLTQPIISSGVRVRIFETDLPIALKIIEQFTQFIFNPTELSDAKTQTHNSPKSKILIPIDFSDYSMKACNIGFDFAEKMNGEVILLYSYIGPNFSGTLPFNSDGYSSEMLNSNELHEIFKLSQKKMSKFSTELKESIQKGEIPNAKFRTITTEGVPEEIILQCAKQENVQLIVMGTRGKSKKELELIGSVTAEVFDAGKFPVFTVPEEITISHIHDIKNVVFFSNLHQQDLISFDIFARLFNDRRVNVICVPIVDKRESRNLNGQIDSILTYCNKHYPELAFSVKKITDNNFLSDFDQFTLDEKIDLIIIPNKKKNIFARLFNPSMAHKMLFHSDTPMLVIPV